MKFRAGVLVAVVAAGLLIAPPLLGRVNASSQSQNVVMQLDTSQVLVNEQIQTVTAQNGAQATPMQADGHTMLPLPFFNQALGLKTDWQAETQTVTLSQTGFFGTTTVLTIGQNDMLVNKETVALDTPATLVDDTVYLPLRAIAQAYDWNLQFIDDAQGALIFVNTQTQNASAETIADALQKLGPSRTQMLAGGIIGRVGSGTLVVDSSRIEMRDTDKRYRSAMQQADKIYLPLDAYAAASNATIIQQTDNTYLLSQGDRSASIGSNFLYTDEDGVVYAAAQGIANAAGLEYTAFSTDGFALTQAAIANFPEKVQYLESITQTLPDVKENFPDAKGYIALTFDDGPTGGTDGLTVQLLDGLKERGVHATFFMCGYRIKDFHTHMDRYLAEGHELGNHTMNHPQKPILAKMSADGIYKEVADNNDLIKSYTGQAASVMRPVGGALSNTLKSTMKDLGLPIINWSVDTEDWKYHDAARVKRVIVEQARDGDIVLMHDLYPTTVQGALDAIDELQAQGYAFVTVNELAQIKGVTLEPGSVYSRIKG